MTTKTTSNFIERAATAILAAALGFTAVVILGFVNGYRLDLALTGLV